MDLTLTPFGVHFELIFGTFGGSGGCLGQVPETWFEFGVFRTPSGLHFGSFLEPFGSMQVFSGRLFHRPGEHHCH